MKCSKQYRKDHVKEIAENKKQYREDHAEHIAEYRKDSVEYFRQYRIDNDKHIRQYRKDNIEKRVEYDKQYRINHLEKITEFKKQYSKDNPEKIAKYHRQYQKDNAERITKLNKIYYKENREKFNVHSQHRRALKKQLPSTLTVAQWKNIKEKFDNKCCYCGKELPLAQEHFIALSKMGEFSMNNIIPSCITCNSSKRDRDFFTWYPKYKYYSKKRESFILKFLNYKDGIQQLKII